MPEVQSVIPLSHPPSRLRPLLAHLDDGKVANLHGLRHIARMARMRKKADLPSKTCAHCGRPFSWRKKWSRDWENVRYCSDACRAGKGPAPSP